LISDSEVEFTTGLRQSVKLLAMMWISCWSCNINQCLQCVQIGRALEEFSCLFLEEGVHYLNEALQEKLSRNVRIPMAAGETPVYSLGIPPYFENNSWT
jgi:hypothetical protein